MVCRTQWPLLTTGGQTGAEKDDEKGLHYLTSAKGAV